MGRTATRKREKHDRGKVKKDHRGVGRKWAFGAMLAVVIAAGIAAWQWPGTLWEYKKAPSFTLQASTGRAVSLEDYRGKKEVVLIFYMGAG
ncbi:MAG: peroxiredoxin family protein [Candidatus Binatia bacterium]